jgi:hypothetical protein
MNLRFPPDVIATVERLAAERNVTRATLIRRALGVLQAAHDGAKDGHFIGLTKNRENLDLLLVSPL